MKQEINFSITQTGYDSKPTEFLIMVKDKGTAPNIAVYQQGQYSGKLLLSEKGARALINALSFVLCEDKP